MQDRPPSPQLVQPDMQLELPECAYWVAAKLVNNIGPARIRVLLSHFGSMSATWQAPERELRAALDERTLREFLTVRNDVDVAAVWNRITFDGTRAVCWTDVDYPALLLEIPAPPPVLYYRGQISEIDTRAVAIVGTRRATAYGRDMAYRMSYDLAKAGVTIVSGLATGVDGVAHRAALEAGGRTIAVLGSGVDVIYPGQHRDLADRISQQGAVVSDYPMGTQPDRFNFPPRNRIISGLSLGVVVIEAPESSGALITVNFAAEQGRDAFALPGPVNARASAGCLRIIREGATMVRSAEDVMEDLHIFRGEVEPVAQASLPLSPSEHQLLSVMSSQAQHIDDIAAKLGRTISDVSGELMMLELQDLVRNTGGGFYRRA